MDEMMPSARWTTMQPWRGLFGLAVTLGAMMIVTSLFDVAGYLGLFTTIIMSNVPILAVIGAGWQGRYPSTAGLPQPWKGFLLTAFVVLFGVLVGAGLVGFMAGGAATPFIHVQAIITVCVTFYLILAFGTWPFNGLSLPGKGFLTLIAAYILGWLVSMAGNFGYLTHARGVIESPVFKVPFYAAAGPLEGFADMAPMGPVAWESLLAFILCSLAFLFCFLALQFWPFSRYDSMRKQPLMGISVTCMCAMLGYILYAIGILGMKIVPLQFMLYIVSFLFGLLMIVFMFQMWPGKLVKSALACGLLNIAAAVIIGIIAYHGIGSFCASHFEAEAMHYPNNIFVIANLMLGLTFPAWAAYSALWDFWPLPPTPPPPDAGPAS